MSCLRSHAVEPECLKVISLARVLSESQNQGLRHLGRYWARTAAAAHFCSHITKLREKQSAPLRDVQYFATFVALGAICNSDPPSFEYLLYFLNIFTTPDPRAWTAWVRSRAAHYRDWKYQRDTWCKKWHAEIQVNNIRIAGSLNAAVQNDVSSQSESNSVQQSQSPPPPATTASPSVKTEPNDYLFINGDTSNFPSKGHQVGVNAYVHAHVRQQKMQQKELLPKARSPTMEGLNLAKNDFRARPSTTNGSAAFLLSK
jgi:hypothetical protein